MALAMDHTYVPLEHCFFSGILRGCGHARLVWVGMGLFLTVCTFVFENTMLFSLGVYEYGRWGTATACFCWVLAREPLYTE